MTGDPPAMILEDRGNLHVFVVLLAAMSTADDNAASFLLLRWRRIDDCAYVSTKEGQRENTRPGNNIAYICSVGSCLVTTNSTPVVH